MQKRFVLCVRQARFRLLVYGLGSVLFLSTPFSYAQSHKSIPSLSTSTTHSRSFSSAHHTYFKTIQNWIPKNVSMIAGYQDFSFLRQVLFLLHDYAPTLDFKKQLLSLQTLRVGSLFPFKGQPKGIHPQKGLIWMKTRLDQVRILISYQSKQDQVAFDEAKDLLSLFYHLEVDITLRKPHSNKPTLYCSTHKDWIVCDQSKVETTSLPPTWFSIDLITDPIWCVGHQPHADVLPKEYTWTWGISRQSNELNLSGELITAMDPLLSSLFVHQGYSSLLNYVSPNTPALFKLSLNHSDFIFYSHLIKTLPWLQELNQWIEHGWNGELILTFDGGLDHPVLLIGLQDQPLSWQRLLLYWSKRWNMKFKPHELDHQSSSYLTHLRLTSPHSSQNNSDDQWSIPVVHFDRVLGIALFEVDLIRRVKHHQSSEQERQGDLNHFKPFEFFQTKGATGLYFDPLLFQVVHQLDAPLSSSILEGLLKELLKGNDRELVDLPLVPKQTYTQLAQSLTILTQIMEWSTWLESQALDSKWKEIHLHSHEVNALFNALLLFLKLTDLIECHIHSYLDQHTHFTFDAKWRPL